MSSSTDSSYHPMSEESTSSSEEASVGTEVFQSFVEAVLDVGFKPNFEETDDAVWDEMYNELMHVVHAYFTSTA